MIGDLSDIPEYSGDLDQLEKDAGTLKKAASDIRDTGRDVHNDFQGLASCYTAPEADQLFHTTLPVRDKADAFATKLETVGSALSTFARDARPLVQRMDQLRSEAAAFRKSIEGNHDWRQDQKNIDKNAHLVHEIGRVWGEFQELERSTATKIDGQVGGTRWIADDGSHKKGMYGFNADDAAKADDTPWGKVDEREYTGLDAAWQWTKHNVGGAIKGFFVDGVWDTLKGIGHMVNVFDWDTFTKTWKGIGDVFGGVSAYIMTPYDWAMDKMFGPADHSDTDRQKKALRDFGKSLIAYDEWGTNPARAGGTVAFNVLTLGAGSFLKLGKAGSLAAKAGEAGEAGEAASAASRAAKVANALGKTGRLVDPMTYVGKGAGFAKLKAGDMMAGLKELHSGAADDFLHGADSPKIPQTHAPVTISDKSVRYPDGSILHEDGTMLSPEGRPHQKPIPVESSAADRLARHEISPPSHVSSPSHMPVHADQPVPAHVGGGSGAEGASHASGHGAPTASHQPGHAGHSGSGTATAPTTHHGANGGGHEAGHGSGGHDAGGHDAAGHGPADSGTGHGGGGDPHHGQDGQQPTDHVEEPPAPKPSGHIPEHTFEHVLKGELKYGKDGQPKVVGYHFRPGGRDPYGVKVPRILKIDHKTGLTVGNVWMRNPRDGTWVMKRNMSTFFPSTWTEREVRRAMVKAFENSKVVNPRSHMWEGEYKGITFQGYFDPVTGDAKTIYPIMPRR
ncbi:EndoU domain-containing protein [Streptomyces sp. Li-HN-5-11]|uniref:EndoU domain-containing protein n=1 Tax=Streptomyces sp. Li-HN-5-11 TaxID=3075432 RepID=UPI0028AD671C|nr:EndoU domain-containing protein [Streptomyces sp. Li-HN-5-11]WNM30241.1 EndoU domain-containing protein [Streptomyces sp. Li-HN-5-11]